MVVEAQRTRRAGESFAVEVPQQVEDGRRPRVTCAPNRLTDSNPDSRLDRVRTGEETLGDERNLWLNHGIVLLNLMGALLEREVTPTYVDPRPADIRHSLAEVTKAQEVLGYRPRINIQQGLVKTLAWYRRTLGKNVKVQVPRTPSTTREGGD